MVVPLLNEEPNLVELKTRLDAVLPTVADRYEIVFVDDGMIVEQRPPLEFFDDARHERTKAFLSKIL